MKTPDNGPSWWDCGPQKPPFKILKLQIPSFIFKEIRELLSIQNSENWAYSGIKSKWPFSWCVQWRATKKPTVTLKYYLSLTIYSLYIKVKELYVLRKPKTISTQTRGTKRVRNRFWEITQIPFSPLQGIFRHFFLAYLVEHTHVSNGRGYLDSLWTTELIWATKPSSFEFCRWAMSKIEFWPSIAYRTKNRRAPAGGLENSRKRSLWKSQR